MFGATHATVGNTTTIMNQGGEVIETLNKPTKRPLSDFLDEDLAEYGTGIKRQRRTTGSSITSSATSVNAPGSSNSAVPHPGNGSTGDALTTRISTMNLRTTDTASRPPLTASAPPS